MALQKYPYKLPGTPGKGDAQAERDYCRKCLANGGTSHRLFLNGLPIAFACGDYYFLYAGGDPAFRSQSSATTICCGSAMIFCWRISAKIIVHGHSPVKEPDIRPNRINIDTGAYATGRLTCLVLEGDGMRFL